MLIYFIGRDARAGNSLSAVGHTNTSRIKAKTIKALKKVLRNSSFMPATP